MFKKLEAEGVIVSTNRCRREKKQIIDEHQSPVADTSVTSCTTCRGRVVLVTLINFEIRLKCI